MAKDINYNNIDIDFIVSDCIKFFKEKLKSKSDKKKTKEKSSAPKEKESETSLEKMVKKNIKSKKKADEVNDYIEVVGKKFKAGVRKDGSYHMGI